MGGSALENVLDVWEADPLAYAEEALGQDVDWWLPREVASAISVPNGRTGIKGCHAAGKTHWLSCCVQWWVDCGIGRCITTAPSWPQVSKLLWTQLARTRGGREQLLGGRLLTGACRLVGEDGCEAYGRSTDQGVRFQGEHANDDSPLLIIVDEAPGVREDIAGAIEGIRSGGDVRVVLLGNPLVSAGLFYDVFQSDDWTTITVDAFNTPNFADFEPGDDQVLAQQLASYSPGELAEMVKRDYLVTPAWALEQWRMVGGDPEHPSWAGKVRARFPGTPAGGLYPLALVLRAAQRPAIDDESPLIAGLDIAGEGRDETSLHIVCKGNGAILLSWQSPDAEALWMALAILRPWLERLETINYDVIGVGQLAGPVLRQLQQAKPTLRVRGVNVGAAPVDRGEYVNLKAELYDGLRKRLDENLISGLTDHKTQRQLETVRYDRKDPMGRMRIESKESATKRGVKSPDRAESLILAFAPQSDPLLT